MMDTTAFRSKHAAILEKCDRLQFSDITLALGEDSASDVALFDWLTLEQLAEEEGREDAGQIDDYHIGEEARARVESGVWVPFGIVNWKGSHAEDGYESMNRWGTLYFDLERSTGEKLVVVHDDPTSEKRRDLGSADALFATMVVTYDASR